MTTTRKTKSVHHEIAHDQARMAKCLTEMTKAEATKMTQERASNKTMKAKARMAKTKKS